MRYSEWKAHAKARNVPFKVSLDYWRGFCVKTNVLMGRGITATSLHVDKVIDALGYVEGNLQVLTNAENASKENQRRKAVMWVAPTHQYEKGGLKVVDLTPSQPAAGEEPVPF